MFIKKAERSKAKIKLGLQGPSGSGKTYSALVLANGLTNDWSKIAVIDTENHSASLYAHLGEFNVLNLQAPFTPERYIEAIRCCVKAGMEVIIIDSISHEWDGAGGILEIHSNMTGNSFTAWSKLTPRHNAFVQEILQSPMHVISTVRSKQDYVLSDRNGKMVPEKVGLKSITRDGMDYEFTLVFELDIRHNANTSKDRTGIFINKPEFQITKETGQLILSWCNRGIDITKSVISDRINDCRSIQELLALYKMYPQFKQDLQEEYEAQKKRLMINHEITNQLPNLQTNQNGTQ